MIKCGKNRKIKLCDTVPLHKNEEGTRIFYYLKENKIVKDLHSK